MKKNKWLSGLSTENGFMVLDLKNRIFLKTKNCDWKDCWKFFVSLYSDIFFLAFIIFGVLLVLLASLLISKSIFQFLFIPQSLIEILFLGCVSLILLLVTSFELSLLSLRLLHKIESGSFRFFLEDEKKERLQYHACEHKLANLMEDGLEPTYKNLQKMPLIHERCGSVESQDSYLQEPSSEKLEEAVEIAKEYYQKLEVKKH